MGVPIFWIRLLIMSFYWTSSSAGDTCSDIESTYYSSNYFFVFYNWYMNTHDDFWHKMTFWGGYAQIPSKDNIDDECRTEWGKLVVLKEKHPDISTIDENITTVQACVLNENDICEGSYDVELRKCHGDLFYRFPWHLDVWDYYTCLDPIYSIASCEHTQQVYEIEDIDDNSNSFRTGVNIKEGWMNAFINGKQFLPLYKDAEDTTICEYTETHFTSIVLKDPFPDVLSDSPTRLTICWVYDYDFYDEFENSVYCGNDYIYARICNGQIQFDLSSFTNWYWDMLCFVHHNNIKVEPEISHTTVESELETTYSPVLKYKCTFDIVDRVSYITKWYINGTFQVQMGPSSNLDELAFQSDFLSGPERGYEVQCGVIALDTNNSTEALSDTFFAGWRIKDDSISLSKSGFTTVEIEQTIPVGCYYSDNDDTICEDSITFEDESTVSDMCAGRIRVQDTANTDDSFVKIKTLRKGDQWTSTTHRVMLTSYDSNYDDPVTFDLQVYVPQNAGQDSVRSIRKEKLGAVHVRVTDNYRHRNKRCYSHVDPHMKTVDGIHYEAQKEGDYMLYRNKQYQIEVQQSARYCSVGYEDGPVCACGIAIAVGADTFIFNNCSDSTLKFDMQCQDGGLIDIEKKHSGRYLVRTPIGTIIDIKRRWRSTLDIDIYMSAKDFGNVDGLCGTFDGNRSNDLLHRDNETISNDNNLSYRFADSWRLLDDENLFKNDQRILEPWNPRTNGIADQLCSRPESITNRKCKINRRTRRATKSRLHPNDMRKREASPLRGKRSTESFTEAEARVLCNNSIYATPAVIDFPEYLAEEDPDVVVEQCVYDLTNDGDTSWVEAHVSNLNECADTVLNLNPDFVANNTEIVNTFRSQICVNNCSGNGECLETGVCECHGTFRGADCTDDIRIPPVVYSIEGDGICEVTEEDDCTCFEIRSENIFDGFMCNITEYKMYFNGTKVELQQSTHDGYYEDIFTGECCAPLDRKRRSLDANENEPFIISYEMSVSNDGATYGDINSLFVFDTRCLQQITNEDTVTIELKDGYCFIERLCVATHKFLSTEDCLLCDPAANRYNWTEGTCEDVDIFLTTEMIIGLAIGCPVVAIVSFILCYFCCCKKSRKNRRINDSNACLQTKVTSIRLPEPGNTSYMYYKHKLYE